jgi:hypothetical protein
LVIKPKFVKFNKDFAKKIQPESVVTEVKDAPLNILDSSTAPLADINLANSRNHANEYSFEQCKVDDSVNTITVDYNKQSTGAQFYFTGKGAFKVGESQLSSAEKSFNSVINGNLN